MREGSDVTLVAFGKMVGYNLRAAELLEGEGISCEVLNLRSLKPIDRDAIAASIRKTHRVVCAEEGWPQHGVASGARLGRLGRTAGAGPAARVWGLPAVAGVWLSSRRDSAAVRAHHSLHPAPLTRPPATRRDCGHRGGGVL